MKPLRFSLAILSSVLATGVLAFSSTTFAAPAATAPQTLETSPEEPTPQSTPAPVVATAYAPPPLAQTYVRVLPGVKIVEGRTLVPASFLQNSLGAAVSSVAPSKWQIIFFEHTVEITLGQKAAIFDGKEEILPIAPRVFGGYLYVPWNSFAQLFGFKWNRPATQPANTGSTVLLLQYPAAYIEAIRHSVSKDKVRIVLDLSNATRVAARYTNSGVTFYLAAARKPGVSGAEKIGDYLVPRVTTTSGNWKAQTVIKLNYNAPATWFTTSDPPRIVVDVQKLFEKSQTENLGGGLALTKIFRGTGHGPVRMFMARIDPRRGWRLHITPAGFGVLQRNRTSRIAAKNKAPLAINGGFFAFDGAAVGAVKINGEWIRLPWKGRSAIAFRKDGKAKIGNLQASAQAIFSNGLTLPIRDLNGWPDRNRITAITRRFAPFVRLRPGDIAVVVDKGVVTSTPGSGGVAIPAHGFILVANGGAIPELQKARRGLNAEIKISAASWDAYPSALGAGPRLVSDGEAEVKEEGFRSDVTSGLGPRTAVGIDKFGRYLIVVTDGRQGYYSTGLTLTELAYTMQKFGAVDAINLDGGGSAAMVVKNKVVNRPSDGTERRVSNALLVMR
jgi:exopolysaccharide biosynthesis protein